MLLALSLVVLLLVILMQFTCLPLSYMCHDRYCVKNHVTPETRPDLASPDVHTDVTLNVTIVENPLADRDTQSFKSNGPSIGNGGPASQSSKMGWINNLAAPENVNVEAINDADQD